MGKKIMVVRSVFCPNDIYFTTTFDKLYNLINFLSTLKDNNNYTLMLIGWATKKYSMQLVKLLEHNKTLFVDIIYQFWEVNYGKYKIINDVKKISGIYDGIFYSDHDISIPLEYYGRDSFFDAIHNICGYNINGLIIGLIAFNQIGDIRHQYTVYQNNVDTDYGIYVYPEIGSFGSIATGTFYIKGNTLTQMEDLNLNSVYGLDDYYLVKNLYNQGYLSVVIKDIYVIHEYNSDIEYNKWKKNKVVDMLKQGINTNYYQDIQESVNFWNGF